MTIRLLVADDHEVIRRGLASLLTGSEITVIAEAESAKETINMATKHNPDVILLDVRLGGDDAFGALI